MKIGAGPERVVREMLWTRPEIKGHETYSDSTLRQVRGSTPEVISPMIPSSGHPIGLLSTGKSCTSSPSPIGPMSFLPSIDHVGPLPEANELGKLHMGPVSLLASVSSMPKLTFLIPRVIGTPQIYFD